MFIAKTRIEAQDDQFRPVVYDPCDPVPDDIAQAVPQCVEEVVSITGDQGNQGEIVDITKLKKPELEDYADGLGLQLDPTKMNKDAMLEAIVAEQERVAAMAEAQSAAGITIIDPD